MSRSTLLTTLALLAGLVLLVCLRLHTADEPLERDITIHAAIGNELLHGRNLYSDLWNHKPPASFFVHAAFIKVFGFGPQYVLAMNLVFNALGLLLVFGLGLSFTRDRLVAVSVALLWALLSFDLNLQANQPNSESLVNPLIVAGILIWYAVSERRLAIGWSLAAGALFFVVTYFKQQYVLVPMAIALALLMHAALFARADIGHQFRATGLVALVGCVGWLLAFAVFWMQGSLQAFVEAAFLYNEGYGGDWLLNLKRSYWMGIFPAYFTSSLYPYIATAVLGLVGALLTRSWKLLLLMLAWSCATWMSVALPGRFFGHYYQLWIPPLLMGTALCLHYLLRLPRVPAVAATVVVLGGLLGYTGMRTASDLSLPAHEWAVRKYPEDQFAEARAVGEALARVLPAQEKIFYFGRDPGVLLYGGLRPVNGKVYVRWYTDNQYSPPLLAHTEAQFAAGGFDVAVVHRSPASFGATGIASGLQRDFVLVPDCFPHNEVWVRRGSPYLEGLQSSLVPASRELLPRYGEVPAGCEMTDSTLLSAEGRAL
ncbi:MAG: hypothetical protein REI94_10830 [Moraxellaceae bacterium]|nr:hypothetical protein [Moraxellaceae bacterium]